MTSEGRLYSAPDVIIQPVNRSLNACPKCICANWGNPAGRHPVEIHENIGDGEEEEDGPPDRFEAGNGSSGRFRECMPQGRGGDSVLKQVQDPEVRLP